MAAATAARSPLSHQKCGFLGSPNRTLLGETASQERACATALLPLCPCAAEVGERSGFPRHRGGGGGVGESTDPHAEEEPLCGEDLRLYASWQNLDRSKKRSAEVDVENRRSFSLALMTLFDIGHADAFDLITVDEDRHFPAGPALPGWTPWHHARSRPILGDRERRRLERGVLKRSSSPERATTATRSSSGLGAGDEEENGGDDGRDADFVPSAGISVQSACSPKRRRTPIMTPAVAAALDRTRISDRTAVHLFTAVHGGPTPLPLAAPCGATGGARGRRWLRRSRRR
ncbi:hypothetical protein GWK47_048888 [Chionoecetes opilio]|uniref:Uncharacterized protein n=1 Tax=Chionoecetes opilio TaxID=41210 RepID=A0A8J5CTU2_CHIOP|nr:hypothetical protein GWK47_048888 [Chionoecetes opilio]